MAKCTDCLHFDVCKKYGTVVDFDVDDGVCLYFEKKLVRCKDCRFSMGDMCAILVNDNLPCLVTGPDHFCSHGERRDGE